MSQSWLINYNEEKLIIKNYNDLIAFEENEDEAINRILIILNAFTNLEGFIDMTAMKKRFMELFNNAFHLDKTKINKDLENLREISDDGRLKNKYDDINLVKNNSLFYICEFLDAVKKDVSLHNKICKSIGFSYKGKIKALIYNLKEVLNDKDINIIKINKNENINSDSDKEDKIQKINRNKVNNNKKGEAVTKKIINKIINEKNGGNSNEEEEEDEDNDEENSKSDKDVESLQDNDNSSNKEYNNDKDLTIKDKLENLLKEKDKDKIIKNLILIIIEIIDDKSDKDDKFNKIKRNKDYIEENIWNKLPKYERIMKRFTFKDYKQNIYSDKWETLDLYSKNKFIEEKIKWRLSRAKELWDNKDNDIENIHKINNFFYYEFKDAKGFNLKLDDVDLKKYKKEMQNKIIKDLETELFRYNKENRVVGFIKINGRIHYNNGKAFYNISRKDSNVIKLMVKPNKVKKEKSQ